MAFIIIIIIIIIIIVCLITWYECEYLCDELPTFTQE